MKSPDEVEDYNLISIVDFTVTERLNNCCSKEDIKAATFEELEEEDATTVHIAWLGVKQLLRYDRHFEPLDLLSREVKLSTPSIESPLILELKLLPSHLKYVYLGKNNTLPIIISSFLNTDQEKSLVDVLGRYKKAIGWTMTNTK